MRKGVKVSDRLSILIIFSIPIEYTHIKNITTHYQFYNNNRLSFCFCFLKLSKSPQKHKSKVT